MGRGPAVSQEPFTACASSPYPLRTPPGSSASIASKPAILAKIMHRRPAADLSDRGPIFDFGAMHAVARARRRRAARARPRARDSFLEFLQVANSPILQWHPSDRSIFLGRREYVNQELLLDLLVFE